MGFETGRFTGAFAGTQRDWVLDAPAGYGCILADPPWQFSVRSEKGKGRSPDGFVERPWQDSKRKTERHYKTMPLAEILALPVGALAARDCCLFLWAIDPMLPQAIQVGQHWGFEYKTVAFSWAKQRRTTSKRKDMVDDPTPGFPIGPGYWTRANPELCLFFTRGEPKRRSASVRQLVIAPRREHSRKPDRIRTDCQRLVRGPYLELFARQPARGWDAWGNEDLEPTEPASPKPEPTMLMEHAQ